MAVMFSNTISGAVVFSPFDIGGQRISKTELRFLSFLYLLVDAALGLLNAFSSRRILGINFQRLFKFL